MSRFTQCIPRRRRRALFVAAAMVLPGVATAANALRVWAAGTTATQSAAVPKKRTVTYVGDAYRAQETPQGTIMTLSGNVRFASEDSTLATDLATYNKTTAIADSPGKLHLEDSRNAVVGDKGVAYYKPRDAKVTGNVVITVKPKTAAKPAPTGSARSEWNAVATIYCTNLQYNWHTRIATVSGGLTLKYKDYTVTADRAVYDTNADRVLLDGNLHFTRANRRDSGFGPRATAIITEGSESFSIPATPHGVHGVQEVDDEDTPAPASTTPGAGNTAPLSPPASAPGATPPPDAAAPPSVPAAPVATGP